MDGGTEGEMGWLKWRKVRMEERERHSSLLANNNHNPPSLSLLLSHPHSTSPPLHLPRLNCRSHNSIMAGYQMDSQPTKTLSLATPSQSFLSNEQSICTFLVLHRGNSQIMILAIPAGALLSSDNGLTLSFWYTLSPVREFVPFIPHLLSIIRIFGETSSDWTLVWIELLLVLHLMESQLASERYLSLSPFHTLSWIHRCTKETIESEKEKGRK